MAAKDDQYNSPEHTITREVQFDRHAITSSTLYFAQFMARAKVYVMNIIVGIRSVASLAALTMIVGHKTGPNVAFSNIAGTTTAWISATSVGSYQTVALNRTLLTGECLGLVFTDAKGKIFALYEYQILPA